MTTTKPRASQIRGLASQQAPFLADLIPDSNLPSSTGDYILKGAFFTPDMTVVFDGGQVVNYVTFINDNEVRVNMTLGAAEGTFGVTLNNGIEAYFDNALLVVLGTVYKPSPADWFNLTGNPNLSDEASIKISAFNELSSAYWNKVVPFNLDWSIRFRYKRSPFGDLESNLREANIALYTVVGDVYQMEFQYQAEGSQSTTSNGSARGHFISLADPRVDTGIERRQPDAQYDAYDDLEYNTIDLRWVGGVLRIYRNGTLGYTASYVFTEDVYIRAIVRRFDLVDIKYIELAT